MKNWMKKVGVETPFVIIDSISGRLKPLYSICVSVSMRGKATISSNVPEDEIGNTAGNRELEVYEEEVFTPNLLAIVLSPEQINACTKVMERAEMERDVNALAAVVENTVKLSSANKATSTATGKLTLEGTDEEVDYDADHNPIAKVQEIITYAKAYGNAAPKKQVLSFILFQGSAGNGTMHLHFPYI